MQSKNHKNENYSMINMNAYNSREKISIKKSIKCIQDTKKTDEVEFNQVDLINKIELFIKKNISIKNGEIIYIVKATIGEDDEINSQGMIYGIEDSPLDIIPNGDNNSEEVKFKIAQNSEQMLEYIKDSINTEVPENIYAIKVTYKGFKLHKIKSIHYDLYDLDLYIFEKSQKQNGFRGQPVKIFNDRDSATGISFYPSDN